MRVPTYESNQGITSANAPQSAQFSRSADFQSAGESQLPQALMHLAGGIDKLNGAIYADTIRERQEQLELDLIKDMQAYQADTSQWQDEYTANNKGPAARDAEDQSRTFHQERLTTLREKYGNNQTALKYIETRGGSLSLNSMNTMRDYGKQEGEGYRDSVYAGELELARNKLTDWNTPPEDRQAIRKDLAQKTVALYAGKGRDAAAAVAKLSEFDKATSIDRAQKRLAALELDDPMALQSIVSGGGSTGRSSADFTAQFESGKAGSLAIGYDKNGGTSYGKYQIASGPGKMGEFISWMDKQGEKEVAEALRAAGPANTGSKTGAMPDVWRSLVQGGKITDEHQAKFIHDTLVAPAMKGLPPELQSAIKKDPRLADALHSTAVQHGAAGAQKLFTAALAKTDGNTSPYVGGTYEDREGHIGLSTSINTASLIEALYEERKTQFGSSTPEVRASAIARMDREKAMLLSRGESDTGQAAGQEPAATSPENEDWQLLQKLDPQAALVWQHKAEAAVRQARTAQAAQALDAQYKTMRTGLEGLPREEQDIQAANYMDGIEDDALRAKIKTRYAADRSIEVMRQNAVDLRRCKQFDEYVTEQKALPSQALTLIDTVKDISDAGKERLRKKYTGELNKETPRNREKTGELFAAIDRGDVADQDQLDAFIFEHSLTDKQAKQVETYMQDGGNAGKLKYSTVRGIYSTLSNGQKLDQHPEFFEQVQKALEPGKTPNEQHVRRTVATLLMEGKRQGGGWFGSDESLTYAEALENGHADSWLPPVSSNEEKEISALMQAQGITKINRQRVQEYKKYEIMRLPMPVKGSK